MPRRLVLKVSAAFVSPGPPGAERSVRWELWAARGSQARMLGPALACSFWATRWVGDTHSEPRTKDHRPGLRGLGGWGYPLCQTRAQGDPQLPGGFERWPLQAQHPGPGVSLVTHEGLAGLAVRHR